jgi:Copper chaperone
MAPETLQLTIDGMHCGGCVTRVTNALKKLEGVTVESVEVGSARVRLEGGQTAPGEVLAALERIGFSARPT